MGPNPLQDALLRLSLSSLLPDFLIDKLLLIDLVSSTIEVHSLWINCSLALFPSPNPEEEAEERNWEIITNEKRSTFGVTPEKIWQYVRNDEPPITRISDGR